jgi:hypothetical protein
MTTSLKRRRKTMKNNMGLMVTNASWTLSRFNPHQTAEAKTYEILCAIAPAKFFIECDVLDDGEVWHKAVSKLGDDIVETGWFASIDSAVDQAYHDLFSMCDYG